MCNSLLCVNCDLKESSVFDFVKRRLVFMCSVSFRDSTSYLSSEVWKSAEKLLLQFNFRDFDLKADEAISFKDNQMICLITPFVHILNRKMGLYTKAIRQLASISAQLSRRKTSTAYSFRRRAKDPFCRDRRDFASESQWFVHLVFVLLFEGKSFSNWSPPRFARKTKSRCHNVLASHSLPWPLASH